VPHRDRVMTLAAPFTAQPTEAIKTTWRFGGVSFTEKGVILVGESDRATRMTRTWMYDKGWSSTPRKVWERGQQDRYGDPGAPMRRPASSLIMQIGDSIYLTGAGASPKGDLPFLDRMNLTTLATERIWRSDE